MDSDNCGVTIESARTRPYRGLGQWGIKMKAGLILGTDLSPTCSRSERIVKQSMGKRRPATGLRRLFISRRVISNDFNKARPRFTCARRNIDTITPLARCLRGCSGCSSYEETPTTSSVVPRKAPTNRSWNNALLYRW